MQIKKGFVIAIALILFGLTTRFLFLINGESVLPNFTAVGAVAMFGAVYFKGANRWILPLALLWISDLILNNVVYAQYYDSFQIVGNYWVYASFIIAGILAYQMMKKPSWSRLLGAGIGAGVVFFLITNFGVWATGTMYPKDLSGLMMSYTAGIPFFRNTILGNIFYSFLLFGVYEYAASYFSEVRSVMRVASLVPGGK